MALTYEQEKKRYRKYYAANTGRSGKEEEIRTTPIFSLRVKHEVDEQGSISCASSSKTSHKARPISPQSHPSESESESSTVPSSSSASDSDSAALQAKPLQPITSHPGRFGLSSSESADSRPDSSASFSSASSSAQPEPASTRSHVLPQYGLLGHHIGDDETIGKEEPIMLNVNAPNSAFICGSQGSGKSYTLSCILETCLHANKQTGNVSKPVAGVVFNYDTNCSPSVAEAAYLCSRGIQVNVFTSPCNPKLAETYRELGSKYGNVRVKPLLFRSSDLTVDRMNKLMAVTEGEARIPLYLELIQKILREMAKKGTFS